ncbi:12104_t:CDS:2 [Entrophospora sp. SA101]|nr:12104_t:CDS:2 [Entrophospora sp. SA101]
MAVIFIKSFSILKIIAFFIFASFLIWTFVPNEQKKSLVPGFEEANEKSENTPQSSKASGKLPSKQKKPATSSHQLHSSHCTVAHPGHSLIQYALMIDAGSTGSRIHVYRFNYCKSSPELEDEVFAHIEPGLSAYADDSDAAARSLDELLKVALENVPKELHNCTPVAVKATAGLRLLGTKKSEHILEAVRNHLENKYPFQIIENDGVVIMDGKDEGVYAWITVNYLLNKVGAKNKSPTAAIFDLGGGSTQIVFEPGSLDGYEVAPGEHRYELEYGGHKYILYQHSYLHFGLMEARKAIISFMVKLWNNSIDGIKNDLISDISLSYDGNLKDERHIPHPCLPKNYSESWQIDIDNDDDNSVKLIGTGGGHVQCRFIVEQILNKHKECPLFPCAFDGVYQPSLTDTFSTHDIYAFSYFYDRVSPLGMPSEFTLKELRDLTDQVCSGNYKRFSYLPEAVKELKKNPYYCMDLSFIYELLHTGYEIPLEREIKVAKKIKEIETGWCLGASIAMLDQSFWCREL